MTKEEKAGKTGQEGPNLISYNTVISALERKDETRLVISARIFSETGRKPTKKSSQLEKLMFR